MKPKNELNKTQLTNQAFADSMLDTWLKTHEGKSVVVKSEDEFSFFDNHVEAYNYAYEKYNLENVIIKKIEKETLNHI